MKRTLPKKNVRVTLKSSLSLPPRFYPFYHLRGNQYPSFGLVIPLACFMVLLNMFIFLTIYYLRLHAFFDFCVNGLILNVFFYNVLFSLSIRFLRFVYIIACRLSSFIHITIYRTPLHQYTTINSWYSWRAFEFLIVLCYH